MPCPSRREPCSGTANPSCAIFEPSYWVTSGVSAAAGAGQDQGREASQVPDEFRGPLHRGEMTAAVEFRPLADRFDFPVGQPPDRQEDVAREHRHPDRHPDGRRDHAHRGHRQAVRAGLVKVRRRATRRGKPVQRDVREHLVAVDRVLGHVHRIGPVLESLHDPGQLADGRVRERVRQRLRPCHLQPHVRAELALEPGEVPEPGLVVLVEGAQDHGVFRRERHQHVHVHPGDVLLVDAAKQHRDHRAGIPALRDVARIAEPPHQLLPRPRDAHRLPARLQRLREPESRDGRDHHVERERRV